MLFMLWCRFGYGANWAQVTWDDISTFRKPEWDTDWVWTNFVLHPFQGGLYYLSARNSNLNRLESLAITAAGDAVWEWFYETQEPSINDLVYSFVGGFMTGEIMYRLSLETAQTNEFFGFLINPMRVWTDPITGEKPRGTHGHIKELSARLSIGTSRSNTQTDGDRDEDEHFPLSISPEFYVVYGNPYGHDSNEPFSQFNFRIGGGIGRTSGAWRGEHEIEKKIMYDVFLNSSGILFSRAPGGEDEDCQTTTALVLDYDFRWHSLIDLSALAPSFAINQKLEFETRTLEWNAHLGAILLGITDYYHAHRDPLMQMGGLEHDYSYTTGARTQAGIRLTHKSGARLFLQFVGYAMRDFAWQAQEGQSTGWEFITDLLLQAELPVSEKIRFGAESHLYHKRAFYDSADNVVQSMHTGSVYVRFLFK